MKRRIFLIDDHPMLRIGLRNLLEGSGRYLVSGEAETAPQAIRALRPGAADCVITDLMLKGRKRVDLIRSIRQAAPDILIIVLSMLDRRENEEATSRAGALAFVEKEAPPTKILEILDGIFPSSPDRSERPKLENLTSRERSVFDLLGTGIDKHAIAEILGISVKTVEAHREALKRKLGAAAIRDLVRLAVQTRQRN